MQKNYSLKIAGKSHLQRGLFQAAILKNSVDLTFFLNGKKIREASLSTAQTSLSNSLINTQDKIALFCKRLDIKESQLEYDRSELNKVEKLIYKVLSLGKRLVEAFVPAQWAIVYKRKNDKKWHTIVPDSKVFQADPFVVFKDEKYFIFYEELKYENWRGYLMVAELDLKNACLINEKCILKKDYHLSYPSVFEENGTFYMIPETGEGNSVDLYECTLFPYEWKKKKTLLDNIQAVDSTLLKTKQGWYLFTTEIVKGALCNDELSIYKSGDLLKQKFKKLYDEPVISNVINARMGGHFIQQNGDIFRVAQNCGKRYGYQANINKVLQIEDGYKEETVETIEADFPAFGFHTYNQDYDLIVGDMEIPRFDLYSLKRYTWVQLKRVFNRA